MATQSISSGTDRPQLLKPSGILVIPATQAFMAREKFVVGGSPVRIGWLGNNFREWFLKKIEEPAPGTTLCFAQIAERSLDASIVKELGDKTETTLSQIYWLMSQQPKGEKEGVLFANGWPNIFYVRSFNGMLRVVEVCWFSAGWQVDAYSVANTVAWLEGRRVFSRNCLLSS